MEIFRKIEREEHDEAHGSDDEQDAQVVFRRNAIAFRTIGIG